MIIIKIQKIMSRGGVMKVDNSAMDVNWWRSYLGTSRRNSSNYLSPISQSGQVIRNINSYKPMWIRKDISQGEA